MANSLIKAAEAMTTSSKPALRVIDNDRDEITVTLDGNEIRGWSYADDRERCVKMLCAREFVEGFCSGRAGRNRENALAAAVAVQKLIPPHLDKEKVARLLTTAKLLSQAAIGCAVDHYGDDFERHGKPGWLIDAEKDIEAADAIMRETR